MYFDALIVAQNLIEAGMPDSQAKAIAKEYAHLMQHQIDQFATKDDIKLLRTDIKQSEERSHTNLNMSKNV